MYPDYDDIRKRIKMRPLWHDQYGVPRYEPFKPTMVSVYAVESALVEIQCQGCGARAAMGIEHSRFARDEHYQRPTADSPGSFTPGDFVRRSCIEPTECSGVTMTADVIAVVEFWARGDAYPFEWKRCPEHEHRYATVQVRGN
jgi:hypothetical protein